VPAVGDALQLVIAGIVEHETRAGHAFTVCETSDSDRCPLRVIDTRRLRCSLTHHAGDVEALDGADRRPLRGEGSEEDARRRDRQRPPSEREREPEEVAREQSEEAIRDEPPEREPDRHARYRRCSER
jgi:hypothetical protein